MKNFPAPLFFADTSKKLLVNTQSAQKSIFQTLNNYALFETILLQCEMVGIPFVIEKIFLFKVALFFGDFTGILASSHPV